MSKQNDLLVKVMQHHVVDEVWGPLDPRVHEGMLPELRAASSVAGMAVYLEASEPGRGIALINAFAEEPELCPPLKKPPKPKGPFPPGPEPEPIEPVLVGAALVALADSIRNERIAEVARERGGELMG